MRKVTFFSPEDSETMLPSGLHVKGSNPQEEVTVWYEIRYEVRSRAVSIPR